MAKAMGSYPVNDDEENTECSPAGIWWLCSSSGAPVEGQRLHTRIEGRYVTIFRHHGKLSAIDSICHHAGGPLTQGSIQDIEDLGMSVVSCPWHHFLVSIDKGIKVYKAVELVGGKPTIMGWKTGKEVQRAHDVKEKEGNIYVRLQEITSSGETSASDQDASSELCGQAFELHIEEPIAYGMSI